MESGSAAREPIWALEEAREMEPNAMNITDDFALVRGTQHALDWGWAASHGESRFWRNAAAFNAFEASLCSGGEALQSVESLVHEAAALNSLWSSEFGRQFSPGSASAADCAESAGCPESGGPQLSSSGLELGLGWDAPHDPRIRPPRPGPFGGPYPGGPEPFGGPYPGGPERSPRPEEPTVPDVPAGPTGADPEGHTEGGEGPQAGADTAGTGEENGGIGKPDELLPHADPGEVLEEDSTVTVPAPKCESEPTQDAPRVTGIIDPALCCCPVQIRIVGGHWSGSYEYDPTEAEREARPGCKGVTFEVHIEVEWLECDEFRPCRLEWLEARSNHPRGWESWYMRPFDYYEYFAAEQEHGITRPTLLPWARVMDIGRVNADQAGKSLTSATREAERDRLREARSHKQPGRETIVLRDSPCSDGSWGDMQALRNVQEIHGGVFVHAGCPEDICKRSEVRAMWAQRVEFDAGGENLLRNWFTQWPPWEHYKAGDRHYSAMWVAPTGATAWQRRLQNWWKRNSRPVRARRSTDPIT